VALRDRRREHLDAALDPELLARSTGERPAGARAGRRAPALQTPGGITVALYLDPKPDGRSLLVAQNLKLRAAHEIDRYRDVEDTFNAYQVPGHGESVSRAGRAFRGFLEVGPTGGAGEETEA
jgi:hypothetical protein